MEVHLEPTTAATDFPFLFWCGLALLVVLLDFLLQPTLTFGFAAEDFLLLVSDAIAGRIARPCAT